MRETRIEGSSTAPWVILIIFAIVMGFMGYEMMEFRRAGKKTHGVEIRIDPAEATLRPGQSHLFEAVVGGSENRDVSWSVREGDAGGAVVAAGMVPHKKSVFLPAARYTAPASAGTYHVIVVSKADETRSSTAVIHVGP